MVGKWEERGNTREKWEDWGAKGERGGVEEWRNGVRGVRGINDNGRGGITMWRGEMEGWVLEWGKVE